jgi:hypothetical protein
MHSTIRRIYYILTPWIDKEEEEEKNRAVSSKVEEASAAVREARSAVYSYQMSSRAQRNRHHGIT